MEKKTIFFICFFLLPCLVISSFFLHLVVKNYFYFDTTSPETLFEKSDGRVSITPKYYLTFDEYYEINKQMAKTKGSRYSTVFVPHLIRYPLLYSTNNDLKKCNSKQINVNFSRFKYTNYEFNYSNYHFIYSLKLYDDVYTFSQNMKSEDCYLDENNYERSYFMEPYNNKFIESVSNDFKKLQDYGYSDDEIVEISTIFVQSIPYRSHIYTLNQYPYETIYSKGGNCLDKSVILSGILKNLDYTVFIVTGTSPDGERHAIVGLKCNNDGPQSPSDCYIETTDFIPISSNKFEFISKQESDIPIHTGNKIYSEKKYGPKLNTYLNNKFNEGKKLIEEIDNNQLNLDVLEKRMSSTDCISSYYCEDADYYNYLVYQYNSIIQENTPVIRQIYEIKYGYETKLFDNVKI